MASTNNLQTVTDSEGRVITFRGVSVFEQAKLLRIMKPEQAQNFSYLAMVMVFLQVRSIDGVPMPWPASEALLDAHMEKVGDAGWLALRPDTPNNGEEKADAEAEGYLKN
jgi:hypothetical protein